MDASEAAALEEAIQHLDVARGELSDAVISFHAAGLHSLGDLCDQVLKTVETLKGMDPRQADE